MELYNHLTFYKILCELKKKDNNNSKGQTKLIVNPKNIAYPTTTSKYNILGIPSFYIICLHQIRVYDHFSKTNTCDVGPLNINTNIIRHINCRQSNRYGSNNCIEGIADRIFLFHVT